MDIKSPYGYEIDIVELNEEVGILTVNKNMALLQASEDIESQQTYIVAKEKLDIMSDSKKKLCTEMRKVKMLLEIEKKKGLAMDSSLKTHCTVFLMVVT